MSDVSGTAFLVDGQWYIRYLHGGGAMVPIHASKEVVATLEHGRMCILSGYMSKDQNGCAIGMQASGANVAGS